MSPLPENPLKIAVVGCGAVTELRHLPALAQRHDVQIVALVDNNQNRAQKLADDFLVPRVLPNHQALLDLGVEAAIVAVPNHLHASVSVDLLRAGVHLLVEKPMALTVAECDTMIEAAALGKAVLAVGFVRRFLHAARFVKWAIDDGFLGRIRSFDVRDGYVFAWPMASDFFFRKEKAGGGVLMDAGVHTLDELLWWLGEVRSFEYYDDSLGGVEADCELHLTFESGVSGILEASRTRNLRNTAIIRGERGELEVGLWQNALQLRLSGSPVEIVGQGGIWHSAEAPDQDNVSIIVDEHDDFLSAIRTGRSPAVGGVAAKQSIELVEACYRQRRPLVAAWEETNVERSVR